MKNDEELLVIDGGKCDKICLSLLDGEKCSNFFNFNAIVKRNPYSYPLYKKKYEYFSTK
jgi:hypothetical protein